MKTLTIQVEDSYFEKVLAVLDIFPKRALTIKTVSKLNPVKTQIKSDIKAYDREELTTTPLDKNFWDEMNSFIDNIKPDAAS